jgi:hypothetical protein
MTDSPTARRGVGTRPPSGDRLLEKVFEAAA